MNSTLVHATAVEISGHAVLLTGKSGSGKSSLAVQLLALGANLIADDQVVLSRHSGNLIAQKPPTLPELIEARGVGLIGVSTVGPAPLKLIVDLEGASDSRLPEPRSQEFLGLRITVWRFCEANHFPSAIFLYLKNLTIQPKSVPC